MVRGSRALLKEAGVSKALSDLLVCPLSKQPLRLCPESNSLISDALGVSYPIVDGIPCLVPKDGKLLKTDNASKPDSVTELSVVNNESSGGGAH
ncbi:uncharacterized protein LOC131237149 [Magnolia sinica]|uniref:uncharacterized protein LOC131237149 n=1 Tax=Magnolia sinica TaxID=86752 RepID=UPI002658FB63|nr:uncharacterized protein LOC131237149 [Magnolia sinica]